MRTVSDWLIPAPCPYESSPERSNHRSFPGTSCIYTAAHLQHFDLSFLPSLSQCTGFTRNNEDPSEFVFLLVENYQLTAPVGLRIGWEFLKPSTRYETHLFISSISALLARCWRREVDHTAGVEVCLMNWTLCEESDVEDGCLEVTITG